VNAGLRRWMSAGLRRLGTGALAAAALAAAGPALAEPFAVDLGGVRIGLDAPPGFADTTFMGSPRLQEFSQSLTSASNRVLLFALTDGDLRAFTLGDQPEMHRYMIAVTPRYLEREWVSARQFANFVQDSLHNLGPVAPKGDPKARLDAQPFGKPLVLAELRKEREVASVLQGVRLPPKDEDSDKPPRYYLTTTTLLWLRSKALALTVYTDFETPADVDWIVYTTRRWTDEIRRLNYR